LGFKWRKTQNNRKLLTETQDIREKRISYLRSVRRFRSEGRPIVYLDESYIHSTHMQSKSWADESNNGLRVPISKGDRLIIIHAGGEKGFIPNALKTWKASKYTGDYHDNVNEEMFMKWLKEDLLLSLEPKSVLVVDNASYHNVLIDKAPTSKTRKQEMKDWLSNHNIPFTDDMFVPELYQLIKLYKPRLRRYLLDETVQKEGHTVLRLSPYHPDLNPIELIWADIKGFVARKNLTCNFSEVQAILVGQLIKFKLSILKLFNLSRLSLIYLIN
jgi:transposase